MKLRIATVLDAQFLYELRTDKVAMENSFDKTQFSFSEHKKWLLASLSNPDRCLYIFMKGSDRAGMGRSDWVGDEFMLSWAVHKDFRGKGCGSLIVRELSALHNPSVAQMYESNVSSVAVAKKAGMILVRQEDGVLTFKGIKND